MKQGRGPVLGAPIIYQESSTDSAHTYMSQRVSSSYHRHDQDWYRQKPHLHVTEGLLQLTVSLSGLLHALQAPGVEVQEAGAGFGLRAVDAVRQRPLHRPHAFGQHGGRKWN